MEIAFGAEVPIKDGSDVCIIWKGCCLEEMGMESKVVLLDFIFGCEGGLGEVGAVMASCDGA